MVHDAIGAAADQTNQTRTPSDSALRHDVILPPRRISEIGNQSRDERRTIVRGESFHELEFQLFLELPENLMDPISFIDSCPFGVQVIMGVLLGLGLAKLTLDCGIRIPPLWWWF